MKSIVVYYSLEGNAEYTADIIAKNINAQKLKLEPVKEYPKGSVSKFIWGGKSVVFGDTPKLVPYTFNSSEYDTIIIGTPIWAGSYVPPIKTFLKDNNLTNKKIALFACCAGSDTEKCFDKFRQELPGNNIVATLSLINPKTKQSPENDQKIKEFCDKLK
jgi:flavodoxin